MAFDKQEIIEDLMENNPNLYKKLVASKEIETLTADDLVFLDASTATEAPDLSHIKDEDLPKMNMDIIEAVMSQTA